MKNGDVSPPPSSPPTPPSPLPISVGPGHQKYFFSPSPSSSPPFSPPSSNHASAENLPLLRHKLPSSASPSTATVQQSSFSLDRRQPDKSDTQSSCLKDLLEWFVEKCCSCSTLTL